MLIKSIALVASALFLSTNANGTLVARLGGLAYYDNVADLTWLADANYAQTSGYAAANENGAFSSSPTNIQSDGRMGWQAANDWAAQLTVGGVSGWRLPDTLQPDASCDIQSDDYSEGSNCTGSEIGNLFYNVLGNTEPFSFDGSINTGPFSNILIYFYWSATTYSPNTDQAWTFLMLNGDQSNFPKTRSHYGWAVQSGDVSSLPPETVNFCEYYYDGKDGDTWTYVNQNSTENTYTYENINIGLNAGRIKVGNATDETIYDISGGVLTWYELVEEGPLMPAVNISCVVTLNQETDMEYILLKLPSLIVQSVVYNDVIILVWLDKNYPANSMNSTLGLNGITASSVTDVEWYAKDVGLIKLFGVDAETGNNDGSIKELISHKVKDNGLGGENGGGGGVLNIYLWFSLLPLLIFARIRCKA